MTGTLYLVPAPLDFGVQTDAQQPLSDVLPQATLAHMARIQYWVCENAKTTRAILKRVDAILPLAQPIQQLQIVEIPRAWHKQGDHTHPPDMAVAQQLLQAALQGHDVGLMSEAGMPAIADPGASLVYAAHQLGLTVYPLVGATAIVLALAASGLNGQHFAFHGYLPHTPDARARSLRTLQQQSQKTGQSQWWIETPYRNIALIEHALGVLDTNTRLCIARCMSLPQAHICTQTVMQWRTKKAYQAYAKMPAVFGLMAH